MEYFVRNRASDGRGLQTNLIKSCCCCICFFIFFHFVSVVRKLHARKMRVLHCANNRKKKTKKGRKKRRKKTPSTFYDFIPGAAEDRYGDRRTGRNTATTNFVIIYKREVRRPCVRVYVFVVYTCSKGGQAWGWTGGESVLAQTW